MKTFIFSLLFCLPLFAQTGFKTDDKYIYWEGSFTADNANIIGILDREPNLKVGTFMDNMYKGMGTDVQNTCNGGTGLMKNKMKFDFVILVNPDGYVVKVRNLKILEKFGPMQAKTIANGAEKYFMDGTKMKTDGTSAQNMACLDRFLTSVFSPAPQSTGTSFTSN